MPLVFAAFTPHTPLLIPAIGKEQLEKLDKTKKALDRLEEELYIAKPQVIFIISPHSGLFENSFVINAHPNFVSSFEEFGDLSTKQEWRGAPEISAKINHMCQKQDMPLKSISKEQIDHGISVPLFYLTRHLPNCKIVPIGYSNRSAHDHIKFGRILKEAIMDGNNRIAVIASGDLSHGPDAKVWAKGHFDKKLIRMIKSMERTKILKLEGTTELKEAKECGYKSLLILLGALNGWHYNFLVHSYEHPFGVGYLTGNFYF